MEIVSKVWYTNLNVKNKYYREYKLSLSDNEKNKLIEFINNNKLDVVDVKNYIKSAIKLSKNVKVVNCINGCIEIKNNKIILLSDIYVTDSFLRILKIEKILYGK